VPLDAWLKLIGPSIWKCRADGLQRIGAMMPTRTCVRGDRTFEVTLSGTPTGSDALWTVECVYDKSLNAEIRVPGMDSIVASTEDVAFADTCDRIGKWLRLKI
jgi:hypothetical protein